MYNNAFIRNINFNGIEYGSFTYGSQRILIKMLFLPFHIERTEKENINIVEILMVSIVVLRSKITILEVGLFVYCFVCEHDNWNMQRATVRKFGMWYHNCK